MYRRQMILIVFLLAIPICIADLATFRIPNIYNRLLGYLAGINMAFLGFIESRDIFIALVTVIALFFVGTGMGDLKLLLAIFLIFRIDPFSMTMIVFIIAIAHIVTSTAINRAIPLKIALAPSIFAGLATYLATR